MLSPPRHPSNQASSLLNTLRRPPLNSWMTFLNLRTARVLATRHFWFLLRLLLMLHDFFFSSILTSLVFLFRFVTSVWCIISVLSCTLFATEMQSILLHLLLFYLCVQITEPIVYYTWLYYTSNQYATIDVENLAYMCVYISKYIYLNFMCPAFNFVGR